MCFYSRECKCVCVFLAPCGLMAFLSCYPVLFVHVSFSVCLFLQSPHYLKHKRQIINNSIKEVQTNWAIIANQDWHFLKSMYKLLKMSISCKAGKIWRFCRKIRLDVWCAHKVTPTNSEARTGVYTFDWAVGLLSSRCWDISLKVKSFCQKHRRLPQ